MKKRIIALILSLIMIMTFCAFAPSVIESNCVKIIKADNFTDENIDNYTMEELKALINKEIADQAAAHELAQGCRKLGWAESSEPIVSAQAEWWNSYHAINFYNKKYQELYVNSEAAKWDKKKAEYPAATEIWLYMKSLGWNDYVCAGIMGNLMAEVGGQTLNIQYWLKGNGYYGMCQWSKGYSKIWGADLPGQCNFLRDTIQYEFDTYGKAYYKGFNFNSFLNLTNEKEAALAFAKCYERCGSGSYSIRQKNATAAYNYFVNN